jgi:hypothetical protein
VIDELQEQLTTRERDLDSLEGAFVAWEERLMTFAYALGEVSTECGVDCARTNAAQWDFST